MVSTGAAERHEYLTYANNSTLDLKSFQQQTILECEPSSDVEAFTHNCWLHLAGKDGHNLSRF